MSRLILAEALQNVSVHVLALDMCVFVSACNEVLTALSTSFSILSQRKRQLGT